MRTKLTTMNSTAPVNGSSELFFYLYSPEECEEAFIVELSTVLALGLISFLVNLINVCSVWCPTTLQSYGYFHTLALFCLFHFAYFFLRIATFLRSENDGRLGEVHYPEFYKDFDREYNISQFIGGYSRHILMCLRGLCLLLLSTMVMDALTITCCRTRRGCVKCCRLFYVLFSLVLTGLIYCFVFAVDGRYFGVRELVFGDADSFELQTIVIYGIYLSAFVFLPSFIIVIFGTVNWVSDIHSSRPISHPKRTVRTLDHKLLILSIFVLLIFLVSLILQFSLDLGVFGGSSEDYFLTQWAAFGLWLLFDLLFGLYPLVLLGYLGKYCCCSCCCDEEPFDDLDQ